MAGVIVHQPVRQARDLELVVVDHAALVADESEHGRPLARLHARDHRLALRAIIVGHAQQQRRGAWGRLLAASRLALHGRHRALGRRHAAGGKGHVGVRRGSVARRRGLRSLGAAPTDHPSRPLGRRWRGGGCRLGLDRLHELGLLPAQVLPAIAEVAIVGVLPPAAGANLHGPCRSRVSISGRIRAWTSCALMRAAP